MVDPGLRARVEAYYRAFNARDEKAYLACFHPDGAVGGTLTGVPLSGVGVQKAILRTARGSMGDLTMTAVNLYQAQDEVAVEWAGDIRSEDGARTPVVGVTLFAFDADQRIRLCQVYWNPRPPRHDGREEGNGVDPTRRTIIEAYYRGFNARDWDGIGGLFAEEGTFGGTLSGSGLWGHKTLRSVFESVVVRFPGILMRPGRIFQAQEEVAVHWDGEAQAWDGQVKPIQGIALFRFDALGLIARFRVYWNPRELLQQA